MERHTALVSCVKLMAGMDIAEKRLPQDGRMEVRIARRAVDIRVSTLPTAFGERLQPLQWLGAGCVLAGLIINQVGGRWLRNR